MFCERIYNEFILHKKMFSFAMEDIYIEFIPSLLFWIKVLIQSKEKGKFQAVQYYRGRSCGDCTK